MSNYLYFLLFFYFTNIINAPAQNIKTIGDNLEASDKHIQLCSLLKATTLMDMLKSKGSYTLFAPNDKAFSHVAFNTNKNDEEFLHDLLNYHIVIGKYEVDYLTKMIKKRQNHFILTTISGRNLYLSLDQNENIILKDESKNQTLIRPFPESSSNGVVYGSELLLMPGSM